MESRFQAARVGIAVLATALTAWSVDGTLSAPYGPPAAANTWQQFVIPLTAAAFGTDEATFSDILSNVTRFRVRTEMRSGTDIGNLDEVAVGSWLSASFSSGTEGWSASGDGTLSWVSSGGQPGGYIRISDWATGDWHYAVAPDSWLGDWTPAVGSSISFWFKTNYPELAGVVEISGGAVAQLLSLTSSAYEVGPRQTALMTVGISQARTVATTVTLSSSSTAAFTVPASVTIPAGGRSATFLATAGATAGTSSTITATASGVGSSRVTLQVVSTVWQVVFQAGAGGSLSSAGASGQVSITQTIATDQSTVAVRADPALGYAFARWTKEGVLYSDLNPLTVTNVTADMNLLAVFETATYTLTYLAGEHGAVTGPTPQTVSHGADGTAVQAEPDPAFVFDRWSDGRTDNPRRDTDVTADVRVTALFLPCDTTPEPLSFPALGEVARNATVTSAPATVAGLTCPAALAVSGGQYSLDSGPWTAAPGSVDNGQQIRLRQTAAPEWSTTTQCRLTVGDTLASWEVTSESCRPHQADQDGDWVAQLTPELTRIVQFYNLRGYHCQAGTEDGYAGGPPGADPGQTACGPHQADQNGDWEIQLSPELTRIIQFYNSGGYHCATGTEDGYAPAGGDPKAVPKPGRLGVSRSLRATADGTVEVCLTLEHSRPQALTSLAVQEVLPAGWRYTGLAGAEVPAIAPRPGESGGLGFAWVAMPASWPIRLLYRIGVPADGGGSQGLRGTASFREAAGEMVVETPPAELAVLAGGASAAGPVALSGRFTAAVGPAGVARGRGLWDLSGTYAATAGGQPLVLNLVHEPGGKLSGVATYGLAEGTTIVMPLRGLASGSGGAVTLKAQTRGARPEQGLCVAFGLALALDPTARQLAGALTGTVSVAGAVTPVRERVSLPLPPDTDGTWSLAFRVAPSGTTVSGTALLMLAGGAGLPCRVRGQLAGPAAVLSLLPAPTVPAARGVAIATTVVPLADGSARLDTCRARAFGQSLGW